MLKHPNSFVSFVDFWLEYWNTIYSVDKTIENKGISITYHLHCTI